MIRLVSMLLALLVLGVAASSGSGACNQHNKERCRPAIRIRNCQLPQCYRCGPNEVYNRDTIYCECKKGFVPINGFCGKCKQGYQYDPLRQECTGINPCGINQYLLNGVCTCLPGLVVIQNLCQRCPVNRTYYPEYDACRCSPGYTLTSTGDCILIPCTTNQVYSAEQQKCICAFGYYLIGLVCGQCKNNQVYNGINKTCEPFVPPVCGRHEYFHGCCCFCEYGYVKIRGECARCPKHSTYVPGLDACECDKGYYFVGEEVKMIPYQVQDVGSSFRLNPGYVYSYKGPYSEVPSHEPIIITGSNYDQNGVNKKSANFNNIYPILSP